MWSICVLRSRIIRVESSCSWRSFCFLLNDVDIDLVLSFYHAWGSEGARWLRGRRLGRGRDPKASEGDSLAIREETNCKPVVNIDAGRNQKRGVEDKLWTAEKWHETALIFPAAVAQLVLLLTSIEILLMARYVPEPHRKELALGTKPLWTKG